MYVDLSEAQVRKLVALCDRAGLHASPENAAEYAEIAGKLQSALPAVEAHKRSDSGGIRSIVGNLAQMRTGCEMMNDDLDKLLQKVKKE